MNYLLLNGTMTLSGGRVASAGDVLSEEDLEKSGVGLTRALEDLKVVEETEQERRILAEIHPEAAILFASNAPSVINDEGKEPGVPETPDLNSAQMPNGKAKNVTAART